MSIKNKEQKSESRENKISAVMVVYNEEKSIEKCLQSIKGIVDEILILHDGPCKDRTLSIARTHTKKVFVNKKNIGLPGPILPSLIKKAKGPWILKIDADEFLSEGMKKNIKKLVERKDVDGFAFKWLYRANGKYITKNWPTKTALYRKSKSSFLGLPHWDDPRIDGKIVNTGYSLEHRPPREGLPTWEEYKKKYLGRYARLQAEYTLKSFDEVDKFQWKEDDFPGPIKIRKRFPLMSSIPMAIAACFSTLFTDKAWKEGYPALWLAGSVLVYYPYLGYLIYKLKKSGHK